MAQRPNDGGTTGWRRSASGIIAVTLSLLLTGGCSAEFANGGGTGGQVPPPTAVSVEEYGTTLAGAVDPLESALKDLAKAKPTKAWMAGLPPSRAPRLMP